MLESISLFTSSGASYQSMIGQTELLKVEQQLCYFLRMTLWSDYFL